MEDGPPLVWFVSLGVFTSLSPSLTSSLIAVCRMLGPKSSRRCKWLQVVENTQAFPICMCVEAPGQGICFSKKGSAVNCTKTQVRCAAAAHYPGCFILQGCSLSWSRSCTLERSKDRGESTKQRSTELQLSRHTQGGTIVLWKALNFFFYVYFTLIPPALTLSSLFVVSPTFFIHLNSMGFWFFCRGRSSRRLQGGDGSGLSLQTKN